MLLCNFAKIVVFVTLFFCAGKFTSSMFYANFCNVYAFLVRCNFIVEIACAFVLFCKVIVLVPPFLRRQIQSSTFCTNFLQRLRIFRTLQFYCQNCLCVCASFAKVLCVGKTKRRKGFLFCGANCFNFFATVLKFCYRLPDAGHIVCQSSAPASISILSLGEVGLLSPCLTNIIVTKDSTTNTVA